MMDNKDFKLEIKTIDDTGIFEGHAAVFGNKDLVDDVIVPGAFKKTLGEHSELPILWQHDTREPIGVTLEAAEDQKGLRVKGQLNLDVARGREAYSLLKQGAIKGLSIGYNVVKEAWQDSVRQIKEVRLWEWSLVTFPANPLAQVEAVKAVVPYQDLPIVSAAWDAGKARARVSAWANGDMSKYRKAFLWYDEKNADNLTAYKLPIADIIGGKLRAVDKAIFAAGAAIMGARGGVNIPTADVAKVKAHLAKYYKKLDKQPPWVKGLGFEEILEVLKEVATKEQIAIAVEELRALEPSEDTQESQIKELIAELKKFRSEV